MSLTDEELVKMGTSDLRSLLDGKRISEEEHRELKTRRRRLQNRIYARKCAYKKHTQVSQLELAITEETAEIKSLRQELNRINLATSRLEKHTELLKRFRTGKASQPSAKILSRDGLELGLASLRPDQTRMATPNSNLEQKPETTSHTCLQSEANKSEFSTPVVEDCAREPHEKRSHNFERHFISETHATNQTDSTFAYSDILSWVPSSSHITQKLVLPVGGDGRRMPED